MENLAVASSRLVQLGLDGRGWLGSAELVLAELAQLHRDGLGSNGLGWVWPSLVRLGMARTE